MTAKEKLAKLAAQLSKPQNEYMSTDVAIELIQNITLLKKLEALHLPEITKLICGNRSLMDRFSDEYKMVCPFYQDGSVDMMLSLFKEKDKDSDYYIDHVFLLADDQILESFILAFHRLDKDIQDCSESMGKQVELREKNQTEIDNITQEISGIRIDLSRYSEDSADEIFKDLSKRKSYLKRKLTNYTKIISDIGQRLSELQEKYDVLCEQYRRLLAAFNEAKHLKETYANSLSQSREKAYEICDDRKQIKNYIDIILDTGDIPGELVDDIKEDGFCVQFLSLLSSDFSNQGVSILAIMYQDGIIDIFE